MQVGGKMRMALAQRSAVRAANQIAGSPPKKAWDKGDSEPAYLHVAQRIHRSWVTPRALQRTLLCRSCM